MSKFKVGDELINLNGTNTCTVVKGTCLYNGCIAVKWDKFAFYGKNHKFSEAAINNLRKLTKLDRALK